MPNKDKIAPPSYGQKSPPPLYTEKRDPYTIRRVAKKLPPKKKKKKKGSPYREGWGRAPTLAHHHGRP